MKSGQVTIKDIAKELGISASTVSRALKNHPDISSETKLAVNELARRMKYQPNAVALSLKRSRSNIIGVVIPEIVHYFFSSVISGIEDIAYDAGFTVIICQSNEKYDRELANVQTLFAQRVDGILASVSKETIDFQHFYDLREHHIPMVFFDRIIPDYAADQVIIDDMEASYRATMHLIERGRTRIAHFGAPQNLLIGRKRKQGFLNALKAVGLPVIPEFINEADNFEKARIAVNHLVDSGNIPDGIFAVNDLTAIGAMQTFQKRGIKIPQETAIIGFSDGRFSGITNPTLSSVDQHGYEMGTIACKMLIERVLSENKEYPYQTKVLKAHLIVRSSTV